MPHMDILRQMIKANATVPLTANHGKHAVTLVEPQDPGVSVTISGLPPDSLVIKVDAFRSPDTVFQGSNGECKRPDYAIIADHENKKRVLLIEMKRNKDSLKEITAQLSGGACFIRYCQDIGRMFFKERDFLNGFQYRYISIGHLSIGKRPTKFEKNPGRHDSPDKPLKISWPRTLYFNQLAGS